MSTPHSPDTRTVDWYFDFVSPYAYFGLAQLDRWADRLHIRLKPVLFAAILDHWGQRGPAEIEPKRRWTYQWCIFYAARQGIAFRMPAIHPFNPLAYLRLAIAAGVAKTSVATIFEALWTTGCDPRDDAILQSLANRLRVDTGAIATDTVKQTLRANTDAALARGVFGVPTLASADWLFWGADAAPMIDAWLADPDALDTPEMRRVTTLGVGTTRAGARSPSARGRGRAPR